MDWVYRKATLVGLLPLGFTHSWFFVSMDLTPIITNSDDIPLVPSSRSAQILRNGSRQYAPQQLSAVSDRTLVSPDGVLDSDDMPLVPSKQSNCEVQREKNLSSSSDKLSRTNCVSPSGFIQGVPRQEDCDSSSLPPSSMPSSPSFVGGYQDDHFLSEDDDHAYQGDSTLVGSDIQLPSDSRPSRSQRQVKFREARETRILFADSSDPGVFETSPIRPTNQRQKATEKATESRAINTQIRLDEEDAETERADAHRKAFMNRILDELEDQNIPFVELFDYAIHKGSGRQWVWDAIFKKQGAMCSILDSLMTSQNSPMGRAELHEWALDTACNTIYKEGEAVTASGIMRVKSEMITSEFVRKFDCDDLFNRIREACPSTTRLLRAFATTNRQSRNMNEAKKTKKNFAVSSALIALLGERSRDNIYFRMMMGIWMYGNGASRQQFSISNHLGYSVSYQTLVGQGKRHRETFKEEQRAQKADLSDAKTPSLAGAAPPQENASEPGGPNAVDSDVRVQHQAKSKEQKTRHPGVLELLSHSCRLEARKAAEDGDVQITYDNINGEWGPHDQVLGKTTDIQQNGTSVSMRRIKKDTSDALRTLDHLKAFCEARPLLLDDIDLDLDECGAFRQRLIHVVARIASQHGGPHMKKFRSKLAETQPYSRMKIQPEKSTIYPLPTFHIDESSNVGNAEVIEAVFAELGLDIDSREFVEKMKFVSGDQLSMACLRSVAAVRAGNEGDGRSFAWMVKVLGLFHGKMNATNLTLTTHLGLPNHDLTNPASLAAHNTLLHRKAITASSPPNFRTSRNLEVTWDRFMEHSAAVVDQFANSGVVDKLRAERSDGGEGGDMIFENAALFMRDALILREFADAIKCGDAGRVLTVIKLWAHAFRGGGRNKYAQEALEFIHNFECVWSSSDREIIVKHLFLNPSGDPEGNIEMDLQQEFFNNLLKNIFRAQGGKANFWEWAEMIGPLCIILREMNRKMALSLGSKNSNRHGAPDLSKDIQVLMESLAKHNVYSVIKGRKLAEDDEPARDCISEGRTQLVWGQSTPLDDYNTSFAKLQRRRRNKPLVGISLLHNSTATGSVHSAEGSDLEIVEKLAPSPSIDAATEVAEHGDWNASARQTGDEDEAGSYNEDDEPEFDDGNVAFKGITSREDAILMLDALEEDENELVFDPAVDEEEEIGGLGGFESDDELGGEPDGEDEV
ncbi:hypothetical protein SCHPADRAFT_947209 [Schizopora paradoxa]|uniref:DUF6589 domain-containing protein n=1 Tax=Schizopora paradoxa TaxID=27342 RepID=A0A0H2R6F6_9AGAM|nr:hypothetical protein SCHPADRAFT_947209 [Schizopora paradoxa]